MIEFIEASKNPKSVKIRNLCSAQIKRKDFTVSIAIAEQETTPSASNLFTLTGSVTPEVKTKRVISAGPTNSSFESKDSDSLLSILESYL